MSQLKPKPLFYKDFAVKTLELKGDYEIWARDIEEYFQVSGFPEHFKAIVDYTIPDEKHDLEVERADVDLKARHDTIMLQAKYAVYRSLGESIKREIAKERLVTTTVVELWKAVRSCFYLVDESTVQQIRDDLMKWDLEKAGDWNKFTGELERLYARLDVVAGERSYTPSDKLHKLRNTLSKLEGEKERNICNQIELLVDSSDKEIKDLYEQCYKFADKRMKLLNVSVPSKGAAYSFTKAPNSNFCVFCKKPNHTIAECHRANMSPEEKKRKAEERKKIVCKQWNPATQVCTWERNRQRKCGYLHPGQANAVNSVQEPEEDEPEIAWMFTANTKPTKPKRNKPIKPSIQGRVYKTITNRTGDPKWTQKWVLDGAATINLSNGQGFSPGTKRTKTTTIEVVGQTRIECSEVANFSIPTYLPDGSKGDTIVLHDVPILKTLKYNLLSERYFTSLGYSIIKTGQNCWILNGTTVKCVAHLAEKPTLYFLGSTPEIAKLITPENCRVQLRQIYDLTQDSSDQKHEVTPNVGFLASRSMEAGYTHLPRRSTAS